MDLVISANIVTLSDTDTNLSDMILLDTDTKPDILSDTDTVSDTRTDIDMVLDISQIRIRTQPCTSVLKSPEHKCIASGRFLFFFCRF